MKTTLIATVVALSAAASGCYKASVHLAEGTIVRSPVVDGAYHVSVLGIFEVSDDVNLAAACPTSRPTVIEERLSVLGGLVSIVVNSFVPVLQIMNPSVDCDAPTAQARR